MIGHAVFDLDGTLVDSVPHMAGLLNAMLAEAGEPHLSVGEVRAHATGGGLAMVEALLRGRCGESARALQTFRDRYAAAPTPERSLYPGVREGLLALRGHGVSLALFSNKSQRLCDKILADLDLAPLFDAIVGTAPGVPEKPEVTGLDLALARSGGTRARCCYVGDSGTDHALAKAAGIPLVLAAWGYGEIEATWSGAAIAAAFSDTPGLVLRALSAFVAGAP